MYWKGPDDHHIHTCMRSEYHNSNCYCVCGTSDAEGRSSFDYFMSMRADARTIASVAGPSIFQKIQSDVRKGDTGEIAKVA